MRRDQFFLVGLWFWVLNFGQWEFPIEGFLVVALSKFVASVDMERSAIDGEFSSVCEIGGFDEVFSISLTWLV